MDMRSLLITQLSSGLRTRAADSARIVELLSGTPDGELDAILAPIDLDRMFTSTRGWRHGHRQRAVDLLMRRRLDELSDQRVADLISALHIGRTPRWAQEAIVEVLTGREGEDFHEVKYLLNATGDYHDLEHLVFDDLEEDLSLVVLRHIAEQAQGQASSDVRVLCDIDDTVKSAIHDRRYPRGTIYPGIVRLLHALDEGAAAQPGRAGDLTFVTARPDGLRGLVQRYTRNALSGLGLPPHTVLGGSILNLHTKALIGDRKLVNMDRDRQLFPECRMVFIGDSGQADGMVGATMHRRDPEHIVGTLLHNVTDLGEWEREAWRVQGVHVFDTYAGAAAQAAGLGLISIEQARQVAQDVREGLGLIQLSPGQQARLVSDLVREEALIEELAPQE